jgi:Sortase and related acyltransferases
MEFCSIQRSDIKTIDELLHVYTQSNEDIFRKDYAGQYGSEEASRAALAQDYADFIAEFIAQDDRYIFAVRDSGIYVAALRIIRMSPGGWYIEALETSPEHRRKGFARCLLTQTLRCMRALSARSVVSVIGRDNIASQALHVSCGFTQTGKAAKDIEGAPVDHCRIFEYGYQK